MNDAVEWYENLSAEERVVADELAGYFGDDPLEGRSDELWQRYIVLMERLFGGRRTDCAERGAAAQETAEAVAQMRQEREERYLAKYGMRPNDIYRRFPRDRYTWTEACQAARAARLEVQHG